MSWKTNAFATSSAAWDMNAIYIDNLHRHNRRGIILSWAVPGQGGHGHCNELENERVRDKFRSLGYECDLHRQPAPAQSPRNHLELGRPRPGRARTLQ